MRSIPSAPHAANAKCDDVTAKTPENVHGHDRDWFTGEGVEAWGDHEVILRCGVTEPTPNINLCITANGVDWVLDEKRLAKDGVAVLTTYGRSPAVEVTYHGAREEAAGVVASLNSAVKWIPQESKCIGASDINALQGSTI
ncbi:DUF3515 family protein [Streptomyces sp. SID335]|nr:DUF3515 family protein [Streptomyces sp. SID335]MYZ14499.1 DUF3515 family protein [Streptomyces sp. SID337]NDZ92052.1 DUF3515 family protein [Streptomyces sp. SID10115]NEA03629.1 DUF3515 family protein [Streptomyces sp. SID10116]NEB50368.1 DUF3515 family protein [Streptomyces sp. SID339]